MSKVITLQGLSRFLANCKTFFQDKLLSGVNIKTINNTSLLGSGNIKIEGSGATVLTAPGGESLIIPIPRGDAGLKGSYRIDMTAKYTGGDEVRYIGSLIIECNELAMIVATGYYYGYDLSEILSSIAIWKDDPEIYSQDNLGYYLLLEVDADLDEVIFSVSSLDGDDVSASIGNEDEKVKVADATIRVFELTSNKVSTLFGNETSTTKYPNTKAVADALGKMGVVSQTITYQGTETTGFTYTITNPVTGLIPQNFIDMITAAGAVFNASTGYFEIGIVTNLSYNEMLDIWTQRQVTAMGHVYRGYTQRAILPFSGYNGTQLNNAFYQANKLEYIPAGIGYDYLYAGSGTFSRATSLKRIDASVIGNNSTVANTNFSYCPSLEYIKIVNLNYNLSISNSPNLTPECVADIVSRAGGNTITITLHPTAYARAMADADVQAALATKTNVSLASA